MEDSEPLIITASTVLHLCTKYHSPQSWQTANLLFSCSQYSSIYLFGSICTWMCYICPVPCTLLLITLSLSLRSSLCLSLSFRLPWFPINPITIREMLNRNRATSDGERQRRRENDEKGYRKADGDEKSTSRRKDRTVQRDDTDANSRARQTGKLWGRVNCMQHTHIQTQTGGQWTLHSPLLTRQSSPC